ncbi:MAG: hypothetical protein E7A66_11695, partial [Staphylococcus lugdunensis]|nr:hypothetical protein [Staphylococcus lugdunensis]
MLYYVPLKTKPSAFKYDVLSIKEAQRRFLIFNHLCAIMLGFMSQPDIYIQDFTSLVVNVLSL